MFAVLYNGYRYFVPWDQYNGNKPLAPFYISILKDIPWAVIALVGLTKLYAINRLEPGYLHKKWYGNAALMRLFVFVHIVLFVIAAVHLAHKNIIDILQRDIKNVQYIFLPALLPLLIDKDEDALSYINVIIGLAVFVSLFGLIIYFFIPAFTWDGYVLSTFQSPNNFGFFTSAMSLIVLAKLFSDKDARPVWYVIFALIFGALLTSVSISALLTLTAGALFLVVMTRPSLKALSKFGVFFLIACLLFFYAGLFNKYTQKVSQSVTSYTDTQKFYEELPDNEPQDNNAEKALSKEGIMDLLTNPYEPKAANNYLILSQYTSVGGRALYFKEFTGYLRSAGLRDILFGDFSLKSHFEYDNVYLYFVRNDGAPVTILILILLGSGIATGLKKFRTYRASGNIRMSGLCIGITAFLLTSTIIQFNLSYYLNIYPLNFLTYFLLLMVFFIAPVEASRNR